MTDKTAIDKIRSLKRNAENDMPQYDYGWDAAIDKAIEALTTLEAEKPVEDAESFLDSIFDAIKENGIITNHNYGMRLTKESHDTCIKIISAYHAKQCRIGYTHNVRVNGVRRNKIIKDV